MSPFTSLILPNGSVLDRHNQQFSVSLFIISDKIIFDTSQLSGFSPDFLNSIKMELKFYLCKQQIDMT